MEQIWLFGTTIYGAGDEGKKKGWAEDFLLRLMRIVFLYSKKLGEPATNKAPKWHQN